MLLVLSSIALIGCRQAKTKNDNPVNDTINEANNNNSKNNEENNENNQTEEDGVVTYSNNKVLEVIERKLLLF